MHHLILIREIDQQMAGSKCCGLEGDLVQWDQSGAVFQERRDRMQQIGAIYRAVKEAFGAQVEITVLDPRNFVSLTALLVRDSFRFHRPFGTAIRTIAANSLSTGIFDGEILFRNSPPPPEAVVAAIAQRLEVVRVGAAPD